MSNPSKKTRKALAKRPDQSVCSVGYGKPPEHSRFKPGQSGNPKGRPRGSRNKIPALNEERLKSIILEEAYRTIKVNEGDKQVTVPMAQAIVRSISHSAVKGNTRTQRLFAEMLSSTETANKQLHDEWLNAAMDYKIEWDREIERCKRQGLPIPELVPHPDHIRININTGQVEVTGPMTKEDKVQWDLVLECKVELEAELEELQQLIDKPGRRNREKLEAEITNTLQLLGKIRKVIPDQDGEIIDSRILKLKTVHMALPR